MSTTLYSYTSKISDVIKPADPLPPEQDQTFIVSLSDNGFLSLKFYSGVGGATGLVSRISVPLKTAAAIESFGEPGKDYWLLRVQGNQVPLVLPLEEMQKLMDQIDTLSL